MTRFPHGTAVALAALAVAATGGSAAAQTPLTETPYADMIVQATPHDFDTLWTRVEDAVEAEGMLLLGRASASRGAAGRGIEIPGNAVIDVFRNDFAVRMLAESIAAGFEAPIRFYLTEDADGTTTLSYRPPSAVFAPYQDPELDEMAAEMDEIYAAIAAAAVAE